VGLLPEADRLTLGVFETFSRKVAHMGGVGSGQLTKLLNNAMKMTNLKNAVSSYHAAIALCFAGTHLDGATGRAPSRRTSTTINPNPLHRAVSDRRRRFLQNPQSCQFVAAVIGCQRVWASSSRTIFRTCSAVIGFSAVPM
jgi:hypothetical protein